LRTIARAPHPAVTILPPARPPPSGTQVGTINPPSPPPAMMSRLCSIRPRCVSGIDQAMQERLTRFSPPTSSMCSRPSVHRARRGCAVPSLGAPVSMTKGNRCRTFAEVRGRGLIRLLSPPRRRTGVVPPRLVSRSPYVPADQRFKGVARALYIREERRSAIVDLHGQGSRRCSLPLNRTPTSSGFKLLPNKERRTELGHRAMEAHLDALHSLTLSCLSHGRPALLKEKPAGRETPPNARPHPPPPTFGGVGLSAEWGQNPM